MNGWIIADIHLLDGRKAHVQIYPRTAVQVAEDLAKIVGKHVRGSSVRLAVDGETLRLTGSGQVEDQFGVRLGSIRLSRAAQAPIEQLRQAS